MYGTWPRGLPDLVEVCGVQLPGREDRCAEEPLRRVAEAVKHVCADEVVFRDRPFALFGHSVGGLVAFEIARELRRRDGPRPVCLLCSACAPPAGPSAAPAVHTLPDAEFLAHVRRFGGMPDAILREPDLVRRFMPVLRADLEMKHTYDPEVEAPLEVPIVALGGAGDEVVPPHALEGWRDHTSGAWRRLEFDGNHFFVHTARAQVLAAIRTTLEPLLGGPTR